MSMWTSLYVDEWGEPDVDLRRGRRLYLSQQRVSTLQQMLVETSFDADSKIVHASSADAYRV